MVVKITESECATCSKCGRTNRTGLLIFPSGFCRVCDVVNIARTLHGTGTLFCFDCETIGIGMENEIIRIAVVGQAGLTFHSYVKPRTPIDEASAACGVNGIRNSDVEKARSFAYLLPILREMLEDQAIVAYSTKFDKDHLTADCDRNDLAPVYAHWYCVSELFAQFVGTPGRQPGQYKFHSLKIACERMGVINEHPHEPLSDCYATLGVLKALAEYEVRV